MHTPQQAEAFSALYDAEWTKVVRWCTRILGDSALAEDVTQDALLIVARRLPHLPPDSNLGGYLWTVAKHLAIRRKTGAPTLSVVADGVEEDAAEQVVRAELQAEICAAIRGIPERQRTALVAYELQGLTYAEIGARLDMNPNAVAQLIHRARRSTRAALAA